MVAQEHLEINIVGNVIMKNSNLLSRQVITYGVGHILARSISFLLLPFYSHYFLPSEFGAMTLIYTFLGFMNVIVPLGLGSAMMRYYIPADNEERKNVLSSAYAVTIISSICFFVLSLFFYETINDKIIFGPKLNTRIIWLLSLILVLDCLWSMHLTLLRAHNRSGFFVLSNIVNVLVVVICNLVFVVHFGLGIEGVLISNLIASSISFIITIGIVIEKKFSFSYAKSRVIRKLFKFSIPMLATGVLSMVIELSDRSIISYLMNDSSEVGLYSANYKIGMFMLLVVMGFNMAWQPYFLDKKNVGTLGVISEYSIYVGGLVWAVVSFIVPYIITFRIAGFSIIDEVYWEGLKVIPTIALGYLFHGIYILSVPGMYINEKPHLLMYIRLGGAFLNILLNFLFIPKYGISGAAVATMISFFSMAIFSYTINKSLLQEVRYNTLQIILFMSFILITFLFYNIIYSNPILIVLFFITYIALINHSSISNSLK